MFGVLPDLRVNGCHVMFCFPILCWYTVERAAEVKLEASVRAGMFRD